jgi:osmotically-inducible protein OsmY
MTLRNQIPDKTLLKTVLQNMMRKGTNSSRVTATARSGDVTIAGTIDYEHQRRSVVNSANNIPGVKRVIDQLRVAKRKRV